MSNMPESELDLDLHFLPAWAQESSAVNRYAKYEGGGEEREGRRPGRRDDRHERRGPARGPDRGPSRDSGRGQPRPPAGDNRGQPRRDDRSPGRPERFRREEPREALPPLPEINVAFTPEEKGVESLARQIKLTGRAYPLFEVAQLILQKPDRFLVTFSVEKKPDGTVVQPLWVCSLDETLWLSEQDAVNHVLKRHFITFYQTEKTPTDPPKGTYTFVGQCGLSGVILGPPNYHDYQNKLRKLHTERFARMPFEVYKSRVKIVRDEAVVKQWLDEQSSKIEFVCLNVPEAKRLANREEVEKHFREVHLPNLIKQVESFTLHTPAGREFLPHLLQVVSRRAWEDQKRFPLRLATLLSQQFASHGLQFFKVNKTFTHVSVARPHHLDMNATPVSESVRCIVEFIDATPNCTRRKLFEALAPNSLHAIENVAGEKAGPAEAAEPTPELKAIISDLHWLVHQGHVIEFAKGILETAKLPAPRPPKPQSQPAPEKQPAVAQGTPIPSNPEAAPALSEVTDTSSAPVVEPQVAVPTETAAPAQSVEIAAAEPASDALAAPAVPTEISSETPQPARAS